VDVKPTPLANLPAIAICGYSNSGKTTLIETLVPQLMVLGLKVAVLKHDVHGLMLDTPGKDSDRLYQAGADVVLQGPEQSFVRVHGDSETELSQLLSILCRHYDLVLVEGRKWTPYLEKIWLRRNEADTAPEDATGVRLDLGRDEDRVGPVLLHIQERLRGVSLQTPVYGGILVGGDSSRMGVPKHGMTHDGKTWFEHVVVALEGRVDEIVVLGRATLPTGHESRLRLPDVPGMKGPRAGMLAAMRWAPTVSWLFAACDMPLVTGEAIDWLLHARAPGVWATLPKLAADAGVEPLLAHYDCRAHALLERAAAPHHLKSRAEVITPTVPPELAEAWCNLNSPSDVAGLRGQEIL